MYTAEGEGPLTRASTTVCKQSESETNTCLGQRPLPLSSVYTDTVLQAPGRSRCPHRQHRAADRRLPPPTTSPHCTLNGQPEVHGEMPGLGGVAAMPPLHLLPCRHPIPAAERLLTRAGPPDYRAQSQRRLLRLRKFRHCCFINWTFYGSMCLILFS